MTFNLTNNVFGDISNTLTSVTTLLTVAGGKETLLGGDFSGDTTKNFKLTLVRKVAGEVTQREIVEVTAISGANLTITRAVEACPINNAATTAVQTAYSWAATDQFYMNFTSEMANTLRSDLTSIQSTGATYDYVVADDTARLALTGMTVGQTIFVTGTGKVYLATGATTSESSQDSFGPYDYIVADDAARLALTGMTAGDTIFVIDSASVYVASDATTSAEKPASVPTDGTGNISAVISEDVVIGDALCKDTGDGLIYKSNASSATRANFIGFSSETALSGNTITYIKTGISPNHSGLTSGSRELLTHTVASGSVTDLGITTTNTQTVGSGYEGQSFNFNGTMEITNIKAVAQVTGVGTDLVAKVYDTVNGTLLGTSSTVTAGPSLSFLTFNFTISGLGFLSSCFVVLEKITAGATVVLSANNADEYTTGNYYSSTSPSTGFSIPGGWSTTDVQINLSGNTLIPDLTSAGVIGEVNYGTEPDVKVGQAITSTDVNIGGVGIGSPRTFGVTYTEISDGIVTGIANRLNDTSTTDMIGSIDGTNIVGGFAVGGTRNLGVSFPVPAGSQWNVTLDTAVTSSNLNFTPLT